MGDSRLSADPQAQLRRACAEMDRGLRAGEEAVAERLLGSFPDLARSDELALELIYNEYVVREELGQAPAIDDWYRRFPAYRERLERLFHVDEMLRDKSPGRSTNDSLLATGGGATQGPARPMGRLGRYELLEEVGRGGMGVVYKARQPGVERLVAVKMLRGPEPGSAELERLFNEARLVGRMRHPGIVQIHEAGEHDGQPFLALEFADGGSLDRWLADKTPPAGDAARLTRDLARAVQHAHDAGVIHRDLKPANVLLCRRSTGPLAPEEQPPGLLLYDAKITDFGLARQLVSGEQTRSGQALGTACYMAPEQAEGRPGWARPACDVYALGAILYELLTGRPPHLGDTVVQTLHLVVHAEPVAPRLLRDGLPADLETVCLKCLEKRPAGRYASAGELADDLDRFLDGRPVKARPLPWPARLWRAARRRPALAGLVAVCAAALVTLLAVWVHFTGRLSRQRDLAVENEERAVEEKREADAQRERAVKGEGDARRALDRSSRMLLTATLLRAGQLGETDPARAAALLDDNGLCPPPLRDFAWGSLRCLLHRRLAVRHQHAAVVRSAGWSSDGRRFVTASSDGEVVHWDAATALPTHRHRDPLDLKSFAVAPDGGVALGGEGVIVVSGRDGQTLHRLSPTSDKMVYAMAFLEQHTLAATHADGVYLWDLQRGDVRAKLKLSARQAVAMAMAGDALATAGTDFQIRLWDLQKLTVRRVLKGHQARVGGLAASADGKVLLSADSAGVVLLWDVARGTSRVLGSPRAAGGGSSLEVASAAVSPDGRRVAWCFGAARVAYVYDVANSTLLAALAGHPDHVRGLAFSPDGRRLVTCSGGVTRFVSQPGEVRLYELDAAPYRVLGEGPATGAEVVFAGGDTLLAAGAGTPVPRGRQVRGVRRLSLSTGKEGPPLVPPSDDYLSAAGASDGTVWTGGKDGVLRRWDVASGRVGAEFPQGGRITGLAVSPDGRSVAVTVIGANVRVLSARDGKVTHDTGIRHGNALQPSFSPDGSRLSFFVREKAELGWVHRFHLPAGRLAEPLKLATTSRAWLHDNRTLAVGYADGAVRLHDGDSGEVTATLSGHTDAAYALAVSPDGGLLASGARDGTIRLWDLATRQERLTLRGHTGLVINLAFRPDGKALASSCLSPDRLGGGEVLLWETE